MQTIKSHSGKLIELPSVADDATITHQTIEDDTLLSDEALTQMQPFVQSALPESFKEIVRRGRPRMAQTKPSLTVRYSPEVVGCFKSTGKGWQTRMDEVLKAYVAAQQV